MSVTSAADPCDEDWSEIEQFIQGISELSRDCRTLEAFVGEVLDRTVVLLEASGGGVWILDKQAQTPRFHRIACREVASALPSSDHPSDQLFLQALLRSGEPETDQPRDVPRSPADLHAIRVGAPFRIDHQVAGVIEVSQRLTTSPAALEGTKRLLAMVSDLIGNFLRHQQLAELRETARQWQRYEALSQRAHGSLDLSETAYHLVNDGRLFVGCDRIGLVTAIRGQLKAMAISGIDTFEKRSNLVRSMETLAKAVAATGNWLRYRGATDQLPPQLEQPISDFVDESHSQTIDVVPLFAPSPPAGSAPSGTENSEALVGVLVLERFEARDPVDAEQRIIRLANLSSLALRNAIDYQTLPLLATTRQIRSLLDPGNQKRRRLLIATGLLLLAVIVLRLVPATFWIEGEGQAQPQIRRNIYATLDGEVVRVESVHDAKVRQGQVLLVLRSRPLETELQRLLGEYQTTEKKLLAVSSARVQTDAVDDEDRYPGQLAAEEQELKQQLSNLQTQLSLVREQREQLQIRSPIDGRVMTWNPRELLADRPVQRGQLLVTVADLTGPWILELQVTDRRVGHLIAAERRSAEPLEVMFTLATGSGPSYRGTLETIAGRTEVLDGEQATTRVRVAIGQDAAKTIRPGTAIHAKVNCGRRSLGFVWLHDVFETVRSWLLF